MSSDEIIVKVTGPGKHEVTKQSTDSSERTVSAKLNGDDDGQVSIAGEVRTKCDDEQLTAAMLVSHLNARGATWDVPRLKTKEELEAGWDCIALDSVDPKGIDPLRIQVTHADQFAWVDLKHASEHERDTHVTALVAELFKAVSKKKFKVGHQTDLAVNAMDSPLYAAAPVIDGFRRAHASEVGAYGFERIWVVGPTRDDVFRVDQ